MLTVDVLVIEEVISPSTSSVAVAPGSEKVSPTVSSIIVKPVKVITGGVVSAASSLSPSASSVHPLDNSKEKLIKPLVSTRFEIVPKGDCDCVRLIVVFESTLNCPVSVVSPVTIVNDPSVLKMISLKPQLALLSETEDPFLIFHFPTPRNSLSSDRTWLIVSSNIAVTDFVPSMVTSIWLVVSVEEPDQLLNIDPLEGVALKRTMSPKLYSSEVLSELITSCVIVPSPTLPTLRVYCVLMKLAVMVLLLFIETVNGLSVPEASPVQLVNSYPASGVAVIVTLEFSL